MGSTPSPAARRLLDGRRRGRVPRGFPMIPTRSPFSGSNLRADATAGLQVFLIALPLSLGIAMASGFPPIAGVFTAIVGGMLTSFVGSARLTIKGPAAGMIVIVIGAVTELGLGDPVLGYQRTLAVGVVAGAIQIALAIARLGFVGALMPPAVVHGMLAAIGVIIVSKQAHTILGVVPHATQPLPLLAEIPHSVATMNPEVLLIGGLSLAILFGLPKLARGWVRRIPAPLVVLVVAIPLGLLFAFETPHDYDWFGHIYHLDASLLVRLPVNLAAAVTFPDFSAIASATSLEYILLFTLVGSIESLLSASAVDALDPRKRASDMDRDLLATGIGNTVASAVGGLPMISEIVRSKANIDAGATSPFANFFHGLFLLAFVVVLPGVLQRIPLAALGAMLVYTGTRLASPSEFIHAWHIGREQLVVFVVTMLVTLGVDLLAGVFAGLVLTVAIDLRRGAPVRGLFRADLEHIRRGDELTLRVGGCAMFTNLRGLVLALHRLDGDVKRVIVDFGACAVVDHTTQCRLRAVADEWPDRTLELHGLAALRASSAHDLAARWRQS